jgi:N6-adenosine-specific RNA methylase IME4
MFEPLPDVTAGAILVDPPWNFATRSEKGNGRGAVQHYDVIHHDDLADLPVPSIAADNCVLFLWTTDTHLPFSLRLMRAWGFDYKTVAFYWAKTRRNHSPGTPIMDSDWHMGLGYWTRANPELCLLGTRGQPQRNSRSVRRLIVSPVRLHSQKPDMQYERIEALVSGPYVELFARNPREGWIQWGNQFQTPEP